MQQKKVIEVEDLTKKFGNFIANDNLSFSVYEGEIFGFLGANGAGKTTAMRMICGLLRPTSGKIMVAGCDAYTQTNRLKSQIGYMSQKFSLYEDLTLRENIRFFGGIYGLTSKEIKLRTNELLDELDIANKADLLIASLPQGWKQKVAFSVALIHKPIVVFLDEPTGGVDPITRRMFWEMIYSTSRKGTTVFVTTHYMDEAEYCDRVCVLVDGTIKAIGSPSILKAQYNAETFNDVFLSIAR
jgi:ABC-2 type transport system ATP-binding protein